MFSQLKAQKIWSYNFGTNPVAAFNGNGTNTVRTGANTNFPATQAIGGLSGGTIMTSATGNDGLVEVATTGGVGTAGRLKIVAPTTSSGNNKFGIYQFGDLGATTGSRTQSLKFTASFVGTAGGFTVSIGSTGAIFNSNGAPSVNQCMALIKFVIGSSDVSIQKYDAAAANYISATATTLTKDDAHVVEIYSNNHNTTSTYTKGGVPHTIEKNTYDVWVDEVLLIDDQAKPGSLTGGLTNASSVLSSFMFASHAASADAILYVDDIVYADYIPSDPSVLPVAYAEELSGKAIAQTVELRWATATEIDNTKFNVLRSSGNDFVKIGEVAGKGNSTESNYYSFVDNNPAAGVNYYQLEQVDNDGKISKSKIVSVKSNLTVNVFKIYASENAIQYTVNSEKVTEASLSVTNVNGKAVFIKKFSVTEGEQAFSDAVNFKPGVYVSVFKLGNNTVVQKFIKK